MGQQTPDKFIPYGRPDVDQEDIEAVVDVLKSSFLTTGPKVELFEEALKEQMDAPFAYSCSSGTAALHLACMALGLGEDDQVIVPVMTFCATANAVAMTGAEVIFADVDPETGLIGRDQLENAISQTDPNKLRAVIAVHLNGQMADIPALRQISNKHEVYLIEDACHALGSSYNYLGRNYQVGQCAHSDICCFSFHPVKNIAMGEGGAISTRSEEYAVLIKSLRNHGQLMEVSEMCALPPDAVSEKPIWHREMHHLGYNYRAPDILCALGAKQLKKLKHFKERRNLLKSRYDEHFDEMPDILRPIKKMKDQQPCWHLYPIFIDFTALNISREWVMGQLKERNIGTQVHYMPVPWHPYWAKKSAYQHYPGAERYYLTEISIPLFTGLTESQLDYVAQNVIEILQRASS